MKLFSDLKVLIRIYKALRKFRPVSPDTIFSAGRQLEINAKTLRNQLAVIFEGKNITWDELNRSANKYALALKAQGVRHGDVVGVMLENRMEFLITVSALSKLGAVASLINTNLQGPSFVHCLKITHANHLIFGEELLHRVEEIKDQIPLENYYYIKDAAKKEAPSWATDLELLSDKQSDENLEDTNFVTVKDKVMYIFTSGTTGMPKAALMTGKRLRAAATLKDLFCIKPCDRIYLCLPLYHSTGLNVGFGSALYCGCSIFLRRKFSATHFLEEVRQYNTNIFVYVGELCRYLIHTKELPKDAENPLNKIIGIGLRPDIWLEFKKRFGIEYIYELYGSSEGPGLLINVFNRDCTIGTAYGGYKIIKYDIPYNAIVRDKNGRCQEVEFGATGLLLFQLNERGIFEGYSNPEDNDKKILRNVEKEGDMWFNTGDLIRKIDVGFSWGLPHFQFVDRVGDTFRWKSENVSTTEVCEILNKFHQIKYSNVYGVDVADNDGKAGMAAIVMKNPEEELDLKEFSEYVKRELPHYARPLFLRITPELNVTGTFKFTKSMLRSEGYDSNKVKDPIYCLKDNGTKYEIMGN